MADPIAHIIQNIALEAIVTDSSDWANPVTVLNRVLMLVPLEERTCRSGGRSLRRISSRSSRRS
jgi:hypothetical protein